MGRVPCDLCVEGRFATTTGIRTSLHENSPLLYAVEGLDPFVQRGRLGRPPSFSEHDRYCMRPPKMAISRGRTLRTLNCVKLLFGVLIPLLCLILHDRCASPPFPPLRDDAR